MIRYISHDDINLQKWDECVNNAFNGLVYGLSWWLDAVCEGWDALVQDDYEAVMPLTQGRKLGIDYLYQPYLTQQTGIFAREKVTGTQVTEFLDAIPGKFRFISIQMNSENPVSHADFRISPKKNFIVDLGPDAVMLVSNYHRNCRRNIQKAVHAGLEVKAGPTSPVFVHFIQRNLEKQLEGTLKIFYPVLQRVTSACLDQQCGEIVGVYDRGGNLQAAAWFIIHMNRCLFSVCASTASGKENQAMFLMVDHMIRRFAGTGMKFDFAGSNIPGIAYFNAGFGAKETYYPAITRNTLPFFLKWLKS
jgi:hypothetical protein